MKKRLIATAVAAALSGQSSALTYYVSSNITTAELWGDNLDIAPSPGSFPPLLAFSGTAEDSDNDGVIDSADVTLTGETQFYIVPAAYLFRAVFDISGSIYTPASGMYFTGGTVDIDLWTTSGWIPYATIDGAVTNLPFLTGQPVPWDPYASTAGILLAPGINSLPGLLVPPSSGFNNAAGTMSLIGIQSGLFMDGTITLTP